MQYWEANKILSTIKKGQLFFLKMNYTSNKLNVHSTLNKCITNVIKINPLVLVINTNLAETI